MSRYYAVISDSGAIREVFGSLKELNECGYAINDNTLPLITEDYHEYGYEVVCGLANIKRKTGLSYEEIKEMI